MSARDGRCRAVIEDVTPQVDGGRFAIKRCAGECVVVECAAFADGHDVVCCSLLWRQESEKKWHQVPMKALGDDRWRGVFEVAMIGRYHYTVMAWIDPFQSWRRDFARREDPADVAINLEIGARLIEASAARAGDDDAHRLRAWAQRLRETPDRAVARTLALDEDLGRLAIRHVERRFTTRHHRSLAVTVDPPRARFSSWYELFPRSTAPDASRHGTLQDVIARLPYVSKLGFDILYLPPIHPIGRANRKGRNNSLHPTADDVGSPWAIGASEGGHTALHPALGTMDDFRALVQAAQQRGIAVALDIAFQCAPDHPWVAAHPEWFRLRPDGSVQYAENPPKQYQDIYPLNFESEDWQGLWHALRDVMLFWVGEGVSVFRVDNPHTKAFPFWEWAIAEIKRDHPDVIFLSEAFTRPRVMHRLAKLGFTQSYTYFAWRNTKHELAAYVAELAHGEGREYFRPNFWPNTPDILTEYLQYGGRPAFMTRLVLAATLTANYGIYGPAFELLEHEPRDAGSEEYLDSEKYQIRQWDLARADSLADLIARVNQVRHENPALQQDWNLGFAEVDNEQLFCFWKATADLSNVIVVAANLDPYHAQGGWVELDLAALGIDPALPYQMHDLLSGARYLWHGPRNFLQLDPAGAQVHIFRLRRRVRSERDFDYFL